MMRLIASVLTPLAAAALLGASGNVCAQPAPDGRLSGVRYSSWHGGCEPGRLAGLSCAMRRDARDAKGGLLATLIYVQDETSRYLYVEAAAAGGAVLALDGKRFSEIGCRDGGCSAVMTVDAAMLQRLKAGHVLTIAARDRAGIELRVPLDDFEHARSIYF